MPEVSRPPTTISFSRRATAGSSHSNVTPTRSSPRPSAYTISVADGSRDTRRTGSPSLSGGPEQAEGEAAAENRVGEREQQPVAGGQLGADAGRRAGDGRGLHQAQAERLKRARVVADPLPRGDAPLGG